jgi:alcohol dehydrogenase YqhD (iron-dependent ADH family)
MLNFTFNLPTKLIFGPGEIEQVGTEAKMIGERALIVTGKRSASAFGFVNQVIDKLEKEGVAAVVFDKIEPNPRSTTVDEAAKIARENNCDFIIGLGGGSPMDAAKAIAAGAAMNEPIWNYILGGKTLTKALPTLMIPTLAATGSEADAGGVITNWETHEKVPLIHPLLFPKVSIIDPALTVSVPKDYTIDGGIDIITHVIEGFFTGVDSTPIQDRFAMSITRTVMDSLPKVIADPNDIDARSQLSWCSAIALSGIINQGRGGNYPLHAMEHALSAHYDISHGLGLGLLLPRLMKYTYESRPDKFAVMAKELFYVLDDRPEMELAEISVNKMIEFLDSVERYITMAEAGIADDSKFEQMAEDTLRIYSPTDFLSNPKKLYKDDIIEIFRMSMTK